MDTIIKVRRKITSDALHIEKLKKYIGNQAEVTIHIKTKKSKKVKSAAGFLKRNADKMLIEIEQDAWERAIKEKLSIIRL